MSTNNALDLQKLPIPDVLEILDYETILAEVKADFLLLAPQFEEVINHESEPVVKQLEFIAYTKLQMMQKINNSAKAIMLAHASNADLEHLAANEGVSRLVIDEGNADALPPVLPTYELDDDLRYRTQLAQESRTNAGPNGAYIFFARIAHGNVLDASVIRKVPGTVMLDVYILSRIDNGIADQTLLDLVSETLDQETVLPLCDRVTVYPCTMVEYQIAATLYFSPGPDRQVSLAQAQANIEQYTEQQKLIGRDINTSAIYAALHVSGVEKVDLTLPLIPLTIDNKSAAICTNITLVDGGIYDDLL
ncbi:baseplate J/gp47 family protein [Gammaproteobacteria bacterium AS21]